MTEAILIIGNVAEAFLDLFARYKSGSASRYGKLVFDEARLGDRCAVWGGDTPKALISTYPATHASYLGSLGKFGDITAFCPAPSSDSLCDDLVNDSAAMRRLAEFLSRFDRIRVAPYVASPQLYRLLEHLPAASEKIDLAEIPSLSGMRTASRFDTKSGFRSLMEEWGFPRGLCRLPEGVVVNSPTEAAHAAMGFLSRGQACVCKPDIGAAGLGLVWLTPDGGTRVQDIVNALADTPAFGNDRIVVEEVISADLSVRPDQRSPSVEASISADGDVEVTYVSGQLITESGEFKGVSINYFDLPEWALEQMTATAAYVGRKLHSLGYQGFFDIDLVLASDKTVCALEGNLRRTGGTHAHDAAVSLLGDHYMDTHVVWSRSDCEFSFEPLQPEDLLGRIRPLLIENRGYQSGILPSVMAGLEEGRFGYIGFATSAIEQARLEDELMSRILAG